MLIADRLIERKETIAMIPNIGELRFKKVVYQIAKRTKEQIKEIIETFIREAVNSNSDYYYYKLTRLETKSDGSATFIIVLKRK